MDELIYQFLLQAGFPRASIVADPTLLTSGHDTATPDDATTFAIVDPETADRLAVIDVVDAIDSDQLEANATRVGRHARRIGGEQVQGFIIRVDPNGRSDAEQVQFYRVWPNERIQQLTAKTFPDLDSLRVTHLLALERLRPPIPEYLPIGDEGTSESVAAAPNRVGVGSFVPGVLLLLLAVADWFLLQTRGAGLLNVVQALLATGAAALLTVVAARRGGG